MKTTPRCRPVHVWLLFALALTVAVVATALNPSAAEARTRPENTEPLAGDPTDTNDGPAPKTSGVATKSPATLKYSSETLTGTNIQTLPGRDQLLGWELYSRAFRFGFLAHWRLIR